MSFIVPLCGVLAILKKIKKLGFFSIANPVLSYFNINFQSVLFRNWEKKKDKEIKK